ncbi:MAG: hypothetical protein ABI947_16765 [Chloroflexota bacterium]
MKKMVEISKAITAAHKDFEFVIEPFDKATGLKVNEIVGNLVPIALESAQKFIKTGEATGLDLSLPVAQKAFGGVFEGGFLKNGSELFAEGIRQFQCGTVPKEAFENRLFFGQQIDLVLAKGPQAAFEPLVILLGKRFSESLQFGLAQIIHGLSIQSGDMKAVNYQARFGQHLAHRLEIAFV